MLAAARCPNREKQKNGGGGDKHRPSRTVESVSKTKSNGGTRNISANHMALGAGAKDNNSRLFAVEFIIPRI